MAGWTRPAGLGAVWVAVALVAVTVGVVAVTRLGATLSDRGPLGNEAVRGDLREGAATPAPDQPLVERTITEEFGEMDVACRGEFALGLDVRPDEEAGWRTVSYETGPDDDVDAVFAQRDRSIEIEVYCNLGQPVVGEVERNTLPD